MALAHHAQLRLPRDQACPRPVAALAYTCVTACYLPAADCHRRAEQVPLCHISPLHSWCRQPQLKLLQQAQGACMHTLCLHEHSKG